MQTVQSQSTSCSSALAQRKNKSQIESANQKTQSQQNATAKERRDDLSGVTDCSIPFTSPFSIVPAALAFHGGASVLHAGGALQPIPFEGARCGSSSSRISFSSEATTPRQGARSRRTTTSWEGPAKKEFEAPKGFSSQGQPAGFSRRRKFSDAPKSLPACLRRSKFETTGFLLQSWQRRWRRSSRL